MKNALDRFTKPPVLLGGCGRSGTTLLLSILSAHPGLFCISEETMAFCPTAYLDDYNPMAPFETERFYNENFTSNLLNSYDQWCEKTPKNVLFFKRINDHFNQKVKLIHIVRDGRDVIISRHPTNPKIYWVNPERWISDVNAGLSMYSHPNVHTLRYE
ncbi:MAG: sulfotransferase, partial [Bacteroidales bacterium]|nr:sulfotransferase [Bacteroidales bacterium]